MKFIIKFSIFTHSHTQKKKSKQAIFSRMHIPQHFEKEKGKKGEHSNFHNCKNTNITNYSDQL